jgi:hypothetical protein
MIKKTRLKYKIYNKIKLLFPHAQPWGREGIKNPIYSLSEGERFALVFSSFSKYSTHNWFLFVPK